MSGLEAATHAAEDGARRVVRETLGAVHGGLAGLRLIAERPVAAAAWSGLWLGGFAVAGALAYVSRVSPGSAAAANPLGAAFGPFAVISVTLFLLIWAVHTVAVFRAMLQPDRSAVFFMRFGSDELRLAVLTTVAFGLTLVFGLTPAAVLLRIVAPLGALMPVPPNALAAAGALVTIVVDAWISVRLSLIAVETFAEGRFHLSAYWPLTRGWFWRLVSLYLVCGLAIFGMLLLFAGGMGAVWAAANAVSASAAPAVARRPVLWLLVAAAVLVAGGFWTVTTTLISASQAYAFRAITGVHRRRMHGF